MSNSLRRNCFCYEVYTYSKKALLLFYIITLFYLAVGLSYSQIAVLSMIGNVATLFFEVPTGIISDRWSRKKSLQFAEIMKLLSIILMLSEGDFLLLCLSSAIWGIADALQSGADQAMIYESFLEKEEYHTFLAKVYSRGYAVSAVATAVSPLMFSFNPYLPVIISMFFVVLSFGAVSFFLEISEEEKESTVSEETGFKKQLIYVYHRGPLLKILLLMSFCTLLIMTVNSYTQPLLLNKGLSINILGVFMFLYNVIMSFGAKLATKVQIRGIQYLIACSLGVLAAMAGIMTLPLCLLMLSGYRLMNGMIWPVLTGKVNQMLDSETRATVLSFQSMITSILGLIVDPVVGVAIDRIGLGTFYFAFGIGFTAVVVLLSVTKRHKKSQLQNR